MAGQLKTCVLAKEFHAFDNHIHEQERQGVAQCGCMATLFSTLCFTVVPLSHAFTKDQLSYLLMLYVRHIILVYIHLYLEIILMSCYY